MIPVMATNSCETLTLLMTTATETPTDYKQSNMDGRMIPSTGWMPIGTSSASFTGTFDGNNNTIKNLYINRSTTNYQALFAQINRAANLQKLVLEDASVSGQAYVAALVANVEDDTSSGGRVDNCHVRGTSTVTATEDGIDMTSYAGGLIGYSRTPITDSSSTASVTGTNIRRSRGF